MKECRYRFDIGLAETFGCTNSEDLVHNGSVASCVCRSCPYAKPPAIGFFAQTEQLLIQKARRGEITVAAKPCGGCGSVKRRETDVTQFVFPYWHGGASGDEIRFSIRSIETFYDGKAKVTIVGDRPPWFQGHVISQRRIGRHTPNRAFRDMLAKMWTIATHAEIDSDFVWMMDDIYFLKPVTFDDLATPRAEPWRESTKNSWQNRKTNTMRALQQVGHTTHDYATHLPHHAEKQKLREIFERFALAQNTMLWEVLYGNVYRSKPQRCRPFFARIQKRMDSETIRRITENASVLNHTETAWCDGVRNFLLDRLPNPASTETEPQGYVPQFRKTRKTTQAVKRRPRHTHRAVIEAQQQ